ncbi:hypothetical protein QVD17_26513 [Tagetes erecta]|uniref:BED-type domain-containing protein n=1 Tax=Tagetes erecta TaxID=13708 RepID=A0AAD8KA97_TARER|nr:hypothetical protein QVD17_26513 [Tagetes erecta]
MNSSSTQEEEDTYVDETPVVQLDNDSDTGNVKANRKRKKATNVEGTQRKVKKGSKVYAECWAYFDEIFIEEDDGVKRKYGKCKFCKSELKADPHRNGTNGLKKHSKSCRLNPEVVANKKQKHLVFKKERDGEGSVSVWKHDEVRIDKALLDLFVVAELPFKLVENPAFIEYTNSLNGKVPGDVDFDVCKLLVDFLEKFKTKTDLVSATSKPLAHLFFREILDVDKHLREWGVHLQFCVMAGAMREKYDKYWGKYDKLNDFMYFAVILDPTMKLYFLGHCFEKLVMYDVTKENPMSTEKVNEKVSDMVRAVENRLHELFKTYKERFDKVEYNSTSQQETRNEDAIECDGGNDFLADYLNVEESNLVATETELKRYLNEPKVNFTKRFDILTWWKQNAIRFPIVSRMARDILAIQISTVASESAFSTSGRVLEPYRTRLSTKIVEALVCTQDWVRKSKKPIVDDIDDILNDDDIALEIEDAIHKQNEKGKGMMHGD